MSRGQPGGNPSPGQHVGGGHSGPGRRAEMLEPGLLTTGSEKDGG